MRNNYRRNIGSISSGTMRPEDLLPCLMSELESMRPLQRAHRTLLQDMRKRMDAAELLGLNYFEVVNGEQVAEDIEELETALQEYCLPYFYFGAHSGDGADFGYWLSEGFEEDFDGLKVNDTSEIPTGYTQGKSYTSMTTAIARSMPAHGANVVRYGGLSNANHRENRISSQYSVRQSLPRDHHGKHHLT
jgi:hypothetical protein